MFLIINLFFIPMIMVYLHYKLRKTEMKWGVEFLAKYLISCVVVTMGVRGFYFALSYLFSVGRPSPTSLYYAVVAVAISLILPLVTKNMGVKVKDEQHEKKQDC